MYQRVVEIIPRHPSLKDHQAIREKFKCSYTTIDITLQSKQTVQITCKIIETHTQGDNYFNFIDVPGIFTENDSNIVNMYSYLTSYLNIPENTDHLHPARFITVTENSLIDYKPVDEDEAGLILLETVKALKVKFGEIDQLVGHSLGVILFANALGQAARSNNPENMNLAKNFSFDRGPTSTWGAAKGYPPVIRHALYYLAKTGGWTSDVEENILAYHKKDGSQSCFLFTGVEEDHHFGQANLCKGEKVKKAALKTQNIWRQTFYPSRQIVDEMAQHSLGAHLLFENDLDNHSKAAPRKFLNRNESLSDAIIRRAFTNCRSELPERKEQSILLEQES